MCPEDDEDHVSGPGKTVPALRFGHTDRCATYQMHDGTAALTGLLPGHLSSNRLIEMTLKPEQLNIVDAKR